MQPKRNFVKGTVSKAPKITQAPKPKTTTIQAQTKISKSLGNKMKKKY
jgi:hypothetical protein